MIDCHCHILSGIDDGAKDVEMSIEMARVAAASGTTDIIATPHHMNGVFSNKKPDILEAVQSLNSLLSDQRIPLRIHPGSELHLVPELIQQIQSGEAMTFADKGKAILLELPKSVIPAGTEHILQNILYLGITPIIAHPERNSVLRGDSDRLSKWLKLGCKTQLTAQSCSGDFGSALQKICRRWVEEGWVHLVASDAHRSYGRSPNMQTGISKITQWVGQEKTDVIVKHNPQHLLAGQPLESISPTQKARSFGIFNWFRS